MTPTEVIALAKSKEVKIVDLKLCDILGTWQHFAIPVSELTDSVFTEGVGFDGSSIRGWRAINSSDMLVFPDPATAFIDPFAANTTLSLACDTYDPITKEPYDRDPRVIAKKAEAYLKSTGLADTAYFGPEAEFFIFDGVSYDSTSNATHYKVDSIEGTGIRASSPRRRRPISRARVSPTRPISGLRPSSSSSTGSPMIPRRTPPTCRL